MQTQYSTYRTLLAPVSGHGLSEAEAKDILRQILPHLSELHDRQQSHGSISLDTVAYDYNRMEIILLDSNGTNNPIYLAPEVLQTQQDSPTADIYALGVVIIVLLTGFPPQALKAQNDTWNWQQLCTVSDQFMQILNIALLAEPDLRYVNAGQMLKSLQPIINPSEPTITSLTSDYGTLLLSPTLLKVISSRQSSSPLPLSPESPSSKPLNAELNYSHKTKKLKVNFSNTQIHRKANASKNPSQATTKDMTRNLIAIILGIGVTVSSAFGAYFYMQSKSADTVKQNVELANAANQSKDKEIALTKEIAKEIALTDEERKADDDVDKLISLAKEKYENAGDLIESKTMLQAIPLDSRMRSKADQLLAQWEQDIKKNSALIQKAEKATKDEKWQTAIDTVKGLSSTPYWQLRGKVIVEEAKQKLANSVVAPSSQSVASPLPNVDTPRNNVPVETYTPPVETYTPPAENTPPAEKSSPPLPPAPRVAQ
ncbi:serine/threonine kinase [Pseudanabaena sp. lw0831]|uniref:protein kinase domain-containing protein n=1 Tax=Pseudanabaena sp. lw0831 TaxID=1357935 RepID=UPI001915DDE0|nr:serine/threonine-protein kinase [Pseudanabaena sp. lw0831]GBO52184.1 serine/threonine kinase [Pseudanabaena sp. lw0831]